MMRRHPSLDVLRTLSTLNRRGNLRVQFLVRKYVQLGMYDVKALLVYEALTHD